MDNYKDIRLAADITDEHVQAAADEREGWQGEPPTRWTDVIDRLERDSGEDWGSDPDSEAIRELKRRVRLELYARRG